VSAGRRFDLVASDLDGTLLRSDDTISDRTRAAVHAAIAAGAVFVYATGRPPRWVDPVVDQLDHYGYAVASNGAYVMDLSIEDPDERIVDRCEILPDASREAVERVRSLLPDTAFAADGELGFAREPGYFVRFDTPPGTRVGPVESWLDQPYAKVLFRHPTMNAALFAALVEVVGDAAELTFGATPAHGPDRVLPDAMTLVEMQVRGLSKASALQQLCDRVGLHRGGARAVAFGDMPNDLEMLRWADHGVAMGNAHHDLKAVADEVTTSNDDDGVAAVLEREFPTR
jgi:hydroxymethylpyrimidine pyrophosphatase-like HAD family hydrolase